jgi:PhnB protein
LQHETPALHNRSGSFLDPFGYKWTIGTHVEDVPMKEMETRMASAATG